MSHDRPEGTKLYFHTYKHAEHDEFWDVENQEEANPRCAVIEGRFFTMEALKARDAAIARRAFEAGRTYRSHNQTADDYLRAEGLK